METIQVVLDKKLLQAADRAARESRQNRSALIREALREYITRMQIRAREEQDREGYRRKPQTKAEVEMWKGKIAWPEE